MDYPLLLPPIKPQAARRKFGLKSQPKIIQKSAFFTCALFTQVYLHGMTTTENNSATRNAEASATDLRSRAAKAAWQCRKAAQLKKYWLRSYSLADATVAEVVAEFNGVMVWHNNAQWLLELAVADAVEINARYNWQLEPHS